MSAEGPQTWEVAQSAIDQAPEAVFWMNREAGFSYVNGQACCSIGYTRQELLGMSVCDIDPDFSLEVWEDFWKGLLEAEVRTFETVHQRKDGSQFPVEITPNFIEFGGDEYSCAYARDITQRRQAEEARAELETRLLEAGKLESVGRLAGGVAHDFSNMLSVILGYAEPIRNRLPGDDPRLEDLLEIEKAAGMNWPGSSATFFLPRRWILPFPADASPDRLGLDSPLPVLPWRQVLLGERGISAYDRSHSGCLRVAAPPGRGDL
jgi:PAS domain S-box-containing protein